MLHDLYVKSTLHQNLFFLFALIFELLVDVSIDLKTSCATVEQIAAFLRLSLIMLFNRIDFGYRRERMFKTSRSSSFAS
jgi:hypothetical protein